MIVVLTGGTGGAKFVDGLRQVLFSMEIVDLVQTALPFLHGYIFAFVELKCIFPICEAALDILFACRFRGVI